MGSATTVANRDINQQSVGLAIKYHAPTNACPTRLLQDRIISTKINKKVSFNLCRVLLVICKVLWQGSLSLVKVPIVSCRLARDKLTGRKLMKRRKGKTEELQKDA